MEHAADYVVRAILASQSSKNSWAMNTTFEWPKPRPMYRGDPRHLGPLTALEICDRTWNDGSQSVIGLTPMILESRTYPDFPVYPAYTLSYFPSQAELDSMRVEDTQDGFSGPMWHSQSAYAKADYLTGSEDWHRSIDTVITNFVHDMGPGSDDEQLFRLSQHLQKELELKVRDHGSQLVMLTLDDMMNAPFKPLTREDSKQDSVATQRSDGNRSSADSEDDPIEQLVKYLSKFSFE